jgi:CIC family chloride channel protein
VAKLQPREDQLFLVLALVIGALTGLAVVAFIFADGTNGNAAVSGGRCSLATSAVPGCGLGLGVGYLLFRYFPYARGSGVPQTKAALYAREGRILLRTVLGKFFCKPSPCPYFVTDAPNSVFRKFPPKKRPGNLPGRSVEPLASRS